MFIVIFNIGSRDVTLMTNNHGFIEEFYDYETAVQHAKEWLDEDQFRKFEVFEKSKN
jgi:hypothetical protein